MTGRELAEEFTEIWKDLEVGEINEMLAKNVSVDLLEFFANYARDFAEDCAREESSDEELEARLPNLLIIGYLIRLLEERVP
jgi:hypothetical protein